ncbi:hypothetical protein HMPREF9194_00455 [Treponema maltophilum ATCC 51939]|uniref:DNA polymerase IV n=1 Tax=Treponema maltophilum ATCC 51939 TaxID=1125699 RepID=S3K643_TREMA|nr:hypothetical protein HMPREF9194_00455 [Treponema maltophilum ATCC 51939]
MSAPCFFHVDLDAFFASVEQLDNPEYRGKPVIVGSLPGDRRGVVSTCSYEARKYGVHSAMPIGKAFRLCPSAIFLRGRMKRYHEKSQEVMAVLSEFSPEIRQMSIDEAFMDMSGTERLFGTAEEAAKKLKAQVAERTGLTISIGAASNKYIAKIASGLSKPDGLYIVENGAEEKFMLSLPLKKIWGIGEKTLDRITRAGFNSSRDIHKASLNLLQSLFGSCTGSFLYRAVRGCEVETFDTEAKSRSISSEHTFSFDLTDRYTIDTALLELSWELMYRLLTEGWTSKTVHVKIRYEDFTTVSIQGTSERIISSADDLYGRAKALFDAKYENGRGIRLLGLGAQNLESGDTPVQKELFDFGEKKKAAVEKAVIGIQKKNPAIHIEKARLLHAKEKLQPNKTPAQKIKPKNIPAIFLLVATAALTGIRGLSAQDFTPKPFSFASRVAVFSLTPDSPEVEFYARGSWEAKLETSFGLNLPLHSSKTKGSKNQAPAFTFTPPVFTQKTDLTVWFLLQSKWYFEAAIADNYAKSTVAAGYYGEGFLRHVRVGNRGISFPGSYGIDDIGKGAGAASDQAPGITAHWGSPSWQADALLRYDMLESFEKKWSGTNELNEKKIGLADWQKGARFVLPEGSASLVASVYVESDKGNYKDDRGYVYEKLSSSDYLILPSSNAIILAKKVSGRILVDFLSSGDGSAEKTEIVNKLGTFSAAGTDGSFLQDIQEWFSPFPFPSPNPALEDYSYPPAMPTSSNPSPTFQDRFFTRIGKAGAAAKVHALILQYPPFFSPFADSSLYALSSDVQSTQTSVVSASGIEQASYGTIVADENSYGGAFGGTDFFAKRTQYIRLFNRAVDPALQAGVARTAERYPAAKDNPFIYLTPKAPAAEGNTIPSFIAVQTSSVSHVLDIGTEAVPGSIVMYRNGIKDTAFSYDAKTGLVHPLNPPLAFETVRITWQQHKEGARSGRLSAAAGIQKRLTENLLFDASSSLLWPLAQKDSYSTSSSDAPGSLSAAAKFDWRKNDFSLKNTTALSFEMPDTTGTRRILGMDGSKPRKILLTKKADAEFPETLVPHLKQRPQPPPQPFPGLDLAHKIAIQSTETVRLADTEGYAVRINWALQNTDDWAARTIDFRGAAGALASAREFSIRLKMEPPVSLPANYEIYLQLGASENQLIDGETPLPTWRITEADAAGGDVKKHFNLGDDGWQKVSVYLRDEDRLQLAQSQNARLIIRSTSGTASGTLTVGACEIGSAEFGLSVPADCLLRSAEQSSPVAQSADMLRFNPDGTNSAQFFGWNIPAAGKEVRAYRYTEALALSSYEELVFFIYIEESQKTEFSVKFESESAQGTQTALDFTITKTGMQKIPDAAHGGGWQKAVFNFNRRTLSINGTQLSAPDFSVETCDTRLAPNRIEFAFSASDATNPANGSAYIDEVHVTGSDYRLNFENVFAFDWEKAGTVVSVMGFPLAANPQFTAKIRADVRSGNLKHAAQMPKIGAYADSRIKADIAGMETSVAAVFSAGFPAASPASAFPSGATTANTYSLHSASHSIKTTPVFFITRLLSAGEEYSFAPQAGGAKKTEKAALDFSAVNLPLSFAFKTEGNVSARFLKQEASFESRYSLKKERFEYGIEARLEALQYGQTNRTKISDYSFSDYFSSWLDVSKIQFSAGEKNADKRNIDFTLNQKLLLAENRFEPQLRLSVRNAYANSAKTENTASDCAVFSFPFSINRWQFSADWTKKSSSSAPVEKGGSYARDVLTYARFTDKRLWAYVIPVYDFFDVELPKKMKQSGMNLSSYESLWELSWKRPLFVSPWDIVVPSRASFSAARSVQTSPSDTSDTLQFKANFGFTAFNSFGRFGSYRLADWYEQDEAVSSVTFIYKTDKNDFSNYRFGVSGYNQFMLFFTQSDKLRFSAEYRADTESIWNVKFEALWDRAGKTSIVKDAFVFLFSRLTKNEADAGNIRRQDAVTLSLGTGGSNKNKILQTYGFRHSAEFDINAYAKASVFFGTEISFYDASFGIKNNAGLSAKIRF